MDKRFACPRKPAIKRVLTKRKFDIGTYALKVKRSRAGLGLFTEDPIKKGACIIEYIGRTISEKEEYTSKSKYLFGVTKTKTIDGAIRTNTARYINHSCRPNCEVETYRGHVYVMAKRSIKAGEELSYDYQKSYFNDHIKPKGCKCLKCAPTL